MQWNSKGRLKAILTGVMVEVIVLSGLAHAHPATVAPHAKTLLIQQQASMLSHVKAMAVQELGQLHRMQATATQAARTVQFSLNGEQQMEEMMLGTSQVIRHLANHSPKNLHQLGALHSTVHQIRQESLDVQGQSQIVKIDLARWSAALEKWRTASSRHAKASRSTRLMHKICIIFPTLITRYRVPVVHSRLPNRMPS